MGLKLIFLIVSRAVSLLGLSRREAWWKDAEILMLRHQLAVAGRGRPGARARLTWPDRALLTLLAGTLPIDRLAAMRLIVTPGTILRWHRDIVRRRWSRRSRQGRSGHPATHRKVRSVVLRLARENESLPEHPGSGLIDYLERILQQDAAPRKPLTQEQREALIPSFETDIKLLGSVTGEDFSDWLGSRGDSGGLVGARPSGQRQARNGQPPSF